MLAHWHYGKRELFLDIRRVWDFGGGKSDSAQQDATQQAATQQKAAGASANKQITDASQPSETEKSLQNTYTQKANKAPETLMQEGGPIAQALSQRVLERANNPGMDYDTANIDKAIGTPIWAGLKARGIAAQPGDKTGGGVGTEQYMQQMVPYLAQGRQAQVNTDISNAKSYGDSANALLQYFMTGGTNLANLLQNRIQSGAQSGAGYQYSGDMTAAGTQLNYANLLAQRQYEQQQAMMQGLGQIAGVGTQLALASTGVPIGAYAASGKTGVNGVAGGSNAYNDPQTMALMQRAMGGRI